MDNSVSVVGVVVVNQQGAITYSAGLGKHSRIVELVEQEE